MKKCIKCNIIKELDKFEKERNACKDCRNAYRKTLYKSTPKKIYEVTLESKVCTICNIEKSKDDYAKDRTKAGGLHSWCNSCRSQKNKKFYQKNSEKIKARTNEYYYNVAKHSESHKETRRKYEKNKRKTDPMFKLRRNARAAVNDALKNFNLSKISKYTKYIGCSWEELKIHIEKQFQPGMTWENYGVGKDKWTIDHKLALSNATSEEDLKLRLHYKNLQPLWFLDNIKKSNKE